MQNNVINLVNASGYINITPTSCLGIDRDFSALLSRTRYEMSKKEVHILRKKETENEFHR